jgi:general secretion pathway protein N
MASMRRTRPSAFLLLLCLTLAWVVYKELEAERWRRLPASPKVRTAVSVTLPEPLPAFGLAPLDAFAETTSRPLFMPTRKPPSPEEVVQVEPVRAEALLNVTVSGLVMVAEKSFALVQRQGSSEILRLGAGDTIDGWQVISVLSDRVVFQREEKTQEVELRDQTAPKPKARRRGGRGKKTARPAPGGRQVAPQRLRREDGSQGGAATSGTPTGQVPGRGDTNSTQN